jgi:hypothetical protein
MIGRLLKIGVGLAAVALLIGLLAGGTAQADEEEVDTVAQVTGGSSPPIVNAKWELPDMQSDVAGIQYEANPPTELNGNSINDADDEPLKYEMQVYPNLCDEPEVRQIEYWVAAEDPDGLGDIAVVYSDVWEPPTWNGLCLDGSDPNGEGLCFKYQVDLYEVDCSEIGLWDDSTTPSTLDVYAPLLAAVDTDQVTMAEAEEIVTRCYKNEKKVYRGVELLHHHQPAGMYKVLGTAQDWASGTGTLENWFEVMPIIGLRIDFSLVDWGSILPNVTDVVSGDEDLATSAKPTVKNCGNVLMGLGLHFSEMVHTTNPEKVITEFDATFMGEDLEFLASVEQWFSTCAPPCNPKQLDLSIHPPDKLPPGIYEGTLDVYAEICGE